MDNAVSKRASVDTPAGVAGTRSAWSPRRLNALAERLEASSYLEIGVAKGATFSAVQVPERTGVDPRFTFDYAAEADGTTAFFEMRSDEYFAQLHTDATFDLVFLDGLHTFEQAYRDFNNIILHTNLWSVVLIDDTLPSDVFSTLRSATSALKYRDATGNSSRSWHGDTFKVVYAIHDFHLGLDYRTITGRGNPQTLVWRSTSQRVPYRDSLEAISRLTYFDMMESLQILRCCSEDEAIESCVAEVAASRLGRIR